MVTLSTKRDLVVLTLFGGGLVLWSRILRIEGRWVFNDYDNDSTGLLIGNSSYGSRSGSTTMVKGKVELRGNLMGLQ